MSDTTDVLERHFGKPVPLAYAHYIQRCSELLRDDGLLLYDRSSLVERNATLGVQRFISDFLAVGDDSGGRLVVVRFNDPSAQPFLIDGGALVPNLPSQLLKPLAPSWEDWERADFGLPE